MKPIYDPVEHEDLTSCGLGIALLFAGCAFVCLMILIAAGGGL